MKKRYKLSIICDDDEEVDDLPEIIDEGSIWLDNGEITIELPEEIAKYIDINGILGIA